MVTEVKINKKCRLRPKGSDEKEEFEEGDIVELPDNIANQLINSEDNYAEEHSPDFSSEAHEEMEDLGEMEESPNEATQDEEITEKQNKKIHTLYDKLDWTDDKKESILGQEFDVEHTNELDKNQASKLIDMLNRHYAKKDKEESEVALPDTMQLPPGEAGQKAALKMEKRDDKQIATEVGQIPEKAVNDWFYQFPQKTPDGKKYTVTGLSYTGVMAIMRKQENIDVKVIENVDKGEHYKVKARAVDKARNITFERTKRQPKEMERKDGSTEKDKFADVKAESKAIKKALEAVISPRVIVRAYEQWQKGKKKKARK